MILSKLETMIVYSWIFPLLVPLTLISIVSNIYFYELITSERGTQLFGVQRIFKPDTSHLDPPIHLLWMSIILTQILMAAFAYVLFYSHVFSYCLIVVWYIMDMHFGLKIFRAMHCQGSNQQQQVMNDANEATIIVFHFWIECMHLVGDDTGIFIVITFTLEFFKNGTNGTNW